MCSPLIHMSSSEGQGQEMDVLGRVLARGMEEETTQAGNKWDRHRLREQGHERRSGRRHAVQPADSGTELRTAGCNTIAGSWTQQTVGQTAFQAAVAAGIALPRYVEQC